MTRIVCACAAVLSYCGAMGQTCVPGWGEGFGNAAGFDGEVRALAMFDDGTGMKLYAGGHFTIASGQEAHGIARWEGDRWVQVGGGVSPVSVQAGGAGVYCLHVLNTGTGPALYAGGLFSAAGGAAAVGVARWDGQEWSAMGAGLHGAQGQVRALAVYDDGTGPAIYAGGNFNTSGPTPVRGLARWGNGQWVELPGWPIASRVYELRVLDLGQGPRLLVGGQFRLATPVAGEYWNNIAAWDGEAWSGFGDGVYAESGYVLKSAVFDHGAGPQLTVAGLFGLSASEASLPRVARWTGRQWVQVGSHLHDQSHKYVNSMVVVPGTGGSSLYIGGYFSGASWLSAVNYVARFGNGDWVGLGGGMRGDGEGSGIVRCMLLTEEGGSPVVYAAGAFTVAGDAMASRVAKWDGARWHPLESGRGLITPWSYPSLPAYGRTACVFDDGHGERTFVGGEFVGAGDRVCNSVAAWDGAAWKPLGKGLTRFGAPGVVCELLPFDDGSGPALYAAGDFDSAGSGSPCWGVARWNGAFWAAPGGNGLWSISGSGVTVADGIAMKAHDDGSGVALYVAGQFDYAGAAPAAGVARWDGVAWSGLGNGAGVQPTYTVQALETFDEGSGPRLFAGGGFTTFAGLPALGIVRWDGSTWSEVGGGFPGSAGNVAIVGDLAVVDDGTGAALIAVGRSGVIAPSIPTLLLAKWDGKAWSSLSGAAGTVPLSGAASRVWSFDDGTGSAIYLGGYQLKVSGHMAPVGWLRLRQGAWELPGGGVSHPPVPGNAAVYGAVARREGDREVLMLTGVFTQAGGAPSAGVAEWRGCPVCRADCDGDGALTPSDFGCFQTRFVGGDAYADCNGDGALTASDFGCFQTEFVAGCP